jgi:hypothetical protein
MFFYVFQILFFALAYCAESSERLRSVKISTHASESILEDPLKRAYEIPYRQRGTQGSSVDEFSRSIPFQFSQFGGAGAASQWVGLGRSASETNIQLLDTPLNPAQGGGFDFQSLPGFLFESASYISGNQLGVFDPKTSAGTVLLRPWTQENLNRSEAKRITSMISSLDFRQLSAGSSFGDSAFLIGANEGRVEGPAGSYSHRLEISDRTEAQVNLIGASIKTHPLGSNTFRTPNARQVQSRVIPVVSVRHQSFDLGVFRLSVSGDHQVLKYDNPGILRTRDQSRQLRVQTSWTNEKDWKAGLGFRRIFYESSLPIRLTEDQAHFFLEHFPDLGEFRIQSKLGAQFVSDYEFSPIASVGAVHLSTGLFSRMNFSRRFPSLIDRFYSIPGALPNPGLRPENLVTFEMGSEFNISDLKNKAELWLQGRNHSQQSVLRNGSFQVINLSKDYTVSPILTQEFDIRRGFHLRHSISYKQTLHQRSLFDVVSLIMGTESPRYYRCSMQLNLRTQSRIVQKKTVSVPGHSVLDLESSIQPFQSFFIYIRFENLTNRQIQWNPGYFLPGRTVAGGIQWRS